MPPSDLLPSAQDCEIEYLESTEHLPKRWYQVSIRTYLLIIATVCAYLGLVARPSIEQQRAVKRLVEMNPKIRVRYDVQERPSTLPPQIDSLPGPDWLCELLGIDYFSTVKEVWIDSVTDADLRELSKFERLELLMISRQESVPDARLLAKIPGDLHLTLISSVEDADLVPLFEVPQLRELSLASTALVSDPLLEALRMRLPKCTVFCPDWLVLLNPAKAPLLASRTSLRSLTMPRSTQDNHLASLVGLNHLSELTLSATQITDAGLAQLESLQQLSGLSLQHTMITDQGLKHLAKLKNLTWLDLSRTAITDEGLAQLRGLSQLKVLDLRHTRISDRGLEQLRALKSLYWLDIGAPHVSREGREQLRQFLPDCVILH